MIDFIQKTYAAVKVTTDPPDEGILGLAKKFGGTEADLNSLFGAGGLVEKITSLALGVAGIFALIMFLYGGVFNYVMSFGDDEKIKKASQTMLWSFLGLVIIAVSYTIITRISSVFK